MTIAASLPIAELKVWYQIPFSILAIVDLERVGWKECARSGSDDQRNYFHSFVSDALYGDGGRKPLIEHWVRECGVCGFEAERDTIGEGRLVERHTFQGQIDSVELRRHLPSCPEEDLGPHNPGLGVLIVGVCIKSVSRCTFDTMGRLQSASNEPSQITLQDAENALEWLRRIFSRWKAKAHKQVLEDGSNPERPGDSLSRVRVRSGAEWNVWKDGGALFEIEPWINDLTAPYSLGSPLAGHMMNAAHFGDERAFMTSAIHLASDAGGASDREVFKRIDEAHLLRLAEADAGGSGWLYQETFSRQQLASYHYQRHAPDPLADNGNLNHILIAPHHQCHLGIGEYWREYIADNVEKYYRDMQFLCIFEYYRLLQFSQRLTLAVKEKRDDGRDKPEVQMRFRQRLQGIRADLLEFTHLHHFSNVSSQIQPREMFTMLYDNMGLQGMFEEVSDEIAAANDFLALTEEQASAERAERLNNLVSYGVPLSLIAGLMGANIFVGEGGMTVPGGTEFGFRTQLFQLMMLVAVVGIGWATLTFFFQRNVTTERPPLKGAGIWFSTGIIGAALAGLLYFYVGSSVTNGEQMRKTEENIRNERSAPESADSSDPMLDSDGKSSDDTNGSGE